MSQTDFYFRMMLTSVIVMWILADIETRLVIGTCKRVFAIASRAVAFVSVFLSLLLIWTFKV